MLLCQEGNNTCNLLEENEKNWKKIVTIYNNNKKNRENENNKKKQVN